MLDTSGVGVRWRVGKANPSHTHTDCLSADMLVSKRPKRDILSVLTEQMARPFAASGFGLVAKFEQWLSQQRPAVHQTEKDNSLPPSKRPASPSEMALLLRDDPIGEEEWTSPEEIMQRLCATSFGEETSLKWKCRGCNTTDQQCLVRGEDSTMTCSRCSIVACGVKMVSTHREKACSAEDDRTQHADAPEGEHGFFFDDEVETAEQARSRHARESGGCCIPSSIRRRNGIGNADSKIRRVAAAEHCSGEEELSQLNCTRNRALQIELVGLCKMVAPVDNSLQRHMRITAHQLLVRSQVHDAKCVSGCGISLFGVSAGLIAKVLLRVMAETLLPLHGKQECPIRFECSREELVGLVDRCNRLVLKEGVHSALCRTAIDILLNGAYATPCTSEHNPGVDPLCVSLAKNQSMEILSGDAVCTVRDIIWSLSKTKTISDGVRDASLSSLRLGSIREWVCKETKLFTYEIVALRLARAVNSIIDPGNTLSQNIIVASMQRACQRSSTSMGSFKVDTGIDTIVASVELVFEVDADDDALM